MERLINKHQYYVMSVGTSIISSMYLNATLIKEEKMDSYIHNAKNDSNLTNQLYMYFNLVNKDSLTGSARYEFNKEIVNLLNHISNKNYSGDINV